MRATAWGGESFYTVLNVFSALPTARSFKPQRIQHNCVIMATQWCWGPLWLNTSCCGEGGEDILSTVAVKSLRMYSMGSIVMPQSDVEQWFSNTW